MTEKQEKIRYRLVFNRSGRLNRKGEGLVQVECQQGKRRIYFSTKVYLEPQYWRDGMVVDHELATDLNIILRRMRIDIERVELDFMKRDVRRSGDHCAAHARTHEGGNDADLCRCDRAHH